MTILYQSECGSAPILWLSIVLWSLGTILLIASIISWIHDEDSVYVVGVLFSVFLLICGFTTSADTRYTAIKATINDTVSWQEINEKYELLSQEGNLYTFKLREDSIHE